MTKEYEEYLESPQWKAFRKKAFAHYGRKCDRCPKTTTLQIHHLHYNNIFHEELEDVRVLCKAHHEETHGIKQPKAKKSRLTQQQIQSKLDKSARKREKRKKKKLGKLVQDRMYRQHMQAQKPKRKQVHKPKNKIKRINPKLPSAFAILQMKEKRIAWQMRVVE
jgi:hypothetical protein